MKQQEVSDVIAAFVIVGAVMIWVRPGSQGVSFVDDFSNLFTNSILGVINPQSGKGQYDPLQAAITASANQAVQTQQNTNPGIGSSGQQAPGVLPGQPTVTGAAPPGSSYQAPGPDWHMEPTGGTETDAQHIANGDLRALDPSTNAQIGWWIAPL